MDVVEEAVAAFFTGMRDLLANTPGGWRAAGEHGAELVVGNLPLAVLNVVFNRERRADPGEIDRLSALAAATGLPWSILVRGEPPDEVRAVAARHGRTEAETEPLMICRPERAIFRPSAPDLEIRVVDRARRDALARTMAAGFGMGDSTVTGAVVDAHLTMPGATQYLGDVGGEPVATGSGLLTSGWLTVGNVCVLPEFRHRGYGRRITERALGDAFAAGAAGALLQSSPDGLRLYESIGFETAETWTYLTAE